MKKWFPRLGFAVVLLALAQVGPARSATGASGGGQGGPATENLTPGQMVERARAMLGGMQGVLHRVVQLQELARKQKDIIKLNCVNDKLMRVKANLNVAESASTNLNEASARGDSSAAAHEFQRVSLTQQKMALLRTEAENCIGEELTFVGATQVTVEVDSAVPSGDPTTPVEPLIVLEAPPFASPPE